MSLVANEQAKLTATYLNGVGIALAAIGGVGPWVAAIQGSITFSPAVTVCSAVCVALSILLHWGGRQMLRSLRES